MTSLKTVYTLSIAAIGLVVFLLISCIENPGEDFELQIAPVPLTTTVTVEFLDAATGLQIGMPTGSQTVTLSVQGDDKSSVSDYTQEATTDFETRHGIINFALLNDSEAPTQDNPVELLLVASAPGYLTTSIPASLFKTGGSRFSVYMVNLASPPAGVTVVSIQSGTADNTGKITTPVDVSTPADPVTGGRASLLIPAGVTVTNDNDQPLTGEITATVVFFNHKSEESLRAFPGGFDVNVNNESGNAEEGFFITAGFVSYALEAGGRKGTKFDTAVAAVIEVPPDIINPETGEALKDGEEIPLWHYKPAAGTWDYESKTAATPDSAGSNFILTYGITHLSLFNIDWKLSSIAPWLRIRFRYNSQILLGDNTLAKRSAAGSGVLTPFILKIKRNDENSYFFSGATVTPDDPEVIVTNAPCDIPVTLETYGGCPYKTWGSKVVEDLCDVNGEIIMDVEPNLGVSTNIERIDVLLKVSGSCPDDDVAVKPNVTVMMSQGEECKWEKAGEMKAGELRVPFLVKDQVYKFGIWYEESWYEEEHKVTKDIFEYEFEFPENLCD